MKTTKEKICYSIELTESRRKRYFYFEPFRAGNNERRFYPKAAVWCITKKCLFQRNYGFEDIIMPWESINRISRDDPSRLILIENENAKIRIPFHGDPELLPFLNSLSDRAREHGIQTETLGEIRNDYYPTYSWISASRGLNFKYIFLLLLFGTAMFVPILSGLAVVMYIINRLNDIQPGNDPYFFVLIRAVPALLLLVFLGYCVIRLLSVLENSIWHRERIRRKVLFDSYKNSITEEDRKKYREERKQSAKESDEYLIGEWRKIEQGLSIYRETPRKVERSLERRIASDPQFLILPGLFLFFAFMFSLFIFSAWCSGSLRDIHPSRWSDAGEARISNVEIIERKDDKQNVYYKDQVRLNYTDPEGIERTITDDREYPRGKYRTGNTVSVQRYMNNPEILRITDSGTKLIGTGEIIFLSGLVVLCLILAFLLSFTYRTRIRLLQTGTPIIARTLKYDGRYGIYKNKGSWNLCTPIGFSENRPYRRLYLLLHSPTDTRSLDVTELPEKIEYDPETKIFRDRSPLRIYPVTLIRMTTILLASLIVLGITLP